MKPSKIFIAITISFFLLIPFFICAEQKTVDSLDFFVFEKSITDMYEKGEYQKALKEIQKLLQHF